MPIARRCGARSACRQPISKMVEAASPATGLVYAFSPQQLWLELKSARPRADDPRRRAFEDYQRRLTEAWKNRCRIKSRDRLRGDRQ